MTYDNEKGHTSPLYKGVSGFQGGISVIIKLSLNCLPSRTYLPDIQNDKTGILRSKGIVSKVVKSVYWL